MKNRLSRLLKVLEWFPRSGTPDVDAIALQLGTTPSTVRRDLRDLREAGAFAHDASDSAEKPRREPVTAPVESALLSAKPANDVDSTLSEDELVAMYVGARFLAGEGDLALGDRALRVAQRVERTASSALLERLAELDTRFRFGPRETERRARRLIAQAITERRLVKVMYKGERDVTARERFVEPTAQFFIHDRWSFYGYDRETGEVRQFRHERCKEVAILDEHFTPRSERGLEGFVAQRRRNAAAR
jgi:predicted DNA-binding transcriptional regulator YafY